jgi:signal peptidase I
MNFKKAFHKTLDSVLTILLILIVVIVLVNMFTGYTVRVGFGNSMQPTLESCSITVNEKVDTSAEVEENDIVGYTSDTGREIKHRAIIKEESFDKDSGQIRYIEGYVVVSTVETYENQDISEFLGSIESDGVYIDDYVAFEESESTIQELEGEPVFITQGDGNIDDGDSIYEISNPDAELVTMDKIDDNLHSIAPVRVPYCDGVSETMLKIQEI